MLSLVQSGIVLDSSFGKTLVLVSLAFSSSPSSTILLSHGRQSSLPHHQSLAQGLDLRHSNPIVGPPLSVNFTLGRFDSLEYWSSTCCNLLHSLL